MDKVARSAARASRQAKRKSKAVAAADRMHERKSILNHKHMHERNILDELKQERKSRREDWLQGPLAPRRDVGKQYGVFGAVQTYRLQAPPIDPSKRRKYINIVRGDRVCLLTGKDKGKIGKVEKVEEESETVTVNGLNLYDVEFPEFYLKHDNDKRPYRPYSAPVSLDDVRLVVPLEEPEAGVAKDVIVKHVYGGGPIQEHPYGSGTPEHTRYIAGMDIEIPWPEEDPQEFPHNEADTQQIEAEETTFVPVLEMYPMPKTVIDELRNRHSKFRTRHDPEHIEKIEQEAAYDQWMKSRNLLTPQTEYLTKKAQEKGENRNLQKDADGNFELGSETADFIEKFMKQKQQQQQQQQPPKGKTE